MGSLDRVAKRRVPVSRQAVAVVVLLSAAGISRPVKGQAAAVEPLDAIAFLAGGTWRGEARWPDGTRLKVDVRYTWGPTRRVLHFETYDLTASVPRLLYEGIMFRDPRRGTIAQWNFKTSGDIDASELSRVDSSGFEVRGANTRSVIHRKGEAEFDWELQVPRDTTWQTILRAPHRRRTP